MNRTNSVGTQRRKKAALLEDLTEAARASSTATVLYHAAVAEQMGLGPTDHKALDLLLREGPLAAGELGRRTGIASASVTSLIDRLERRGFVRRVRDTADRRRILVEAVPAGVGRASHLFEPLRRKVERLFDQYTNQQLETIRDYLQRTTAILSEEAARLGGRL